MTPPSEAERTPARLPGSSYLLVTTTVALVFALCLVGFTSAARAASLGYNSPSEITEHTTLCNQRLPFVAESEANNVEQWLYLANDQSADYCNLTVQYRESQKSNEEAQISELKTIASQVTSAKTELESIKSEVSLVKKSVESIDSHILELGNETKPLYTTGTSGGPGSKVEVADFTTGAQTDLSELQQNVETIGWCLIGTIVAMALAVFIYLILRPQR